jgi:hypothetical protein
MEAMDNSESTWEARTGLYAYRRLSLLVMSVRGYVVSEAGSWGIPAQSAGLHSIQVRMLLVDAGRTCEEI